MRKFFFLLLAIPHSICAQRTPIEKYDVAPRDFHEVFLDCVEKNPRKIIDTPAGEYVGQVDSQHMLYGYGMYVNNDGSQIYGMFRNGKPFFTISMNEESAMVGSPTFYASYSLQTGRLEYVYRSQEKQVVDTEGLYDYAFVKMEYANGDQYVGEIYQRKRHGYGVYYYANGCIWIGQYENDVRCGYGVLYDENNQMVVGLWEGEELRRAVVVKNK